MMENSTAKRNTARYHKVGHSSNVDESLFGNGSARNVAPGTTTRKIVTGPVNPQAIVISRNELEKIKQKATIKTEEELMEERRIALLEKEERERKARERKHRMIELEALAKKNAKKSDIELAKAAKEQAIRDMAEEKLVDETDLVKLLTTLGARAAAFTLRDRQLEEKRQREESEAEYDRRLDMEMEIDRIKDLQRREQEENYKRSKRYEDRKVIIEQIQERQRNKMLMAEAREQENQAMRNLMKKYEQDDRAAAERRKIEIEKSREEVIQANADAIARKQLLKDREREEMEEILRYQEERDRELARREEEEEALAHKKKELQAKLLASQERSQSNKAELDELRARRAFEAKEREIRNREREEAQKRKKGLIELNRARAQQAEDKHRRALEDKKYEEDEFQSALAYTQKMVAREENERRHKEEMARHHREQITQQMQEAEERRRRERSGKFEEGAVIRSKFVQDQAKLEAIREKMVADLERQGVNPRYLTEMKAVDIKKILNR